MEANLNQRENRRINHQDDVSKLKEEWLTPLNDLISRINDNFAFFFSSLQCAGEVKLNVPENPVSTTATACRVGHFLVKLYLCMQCLRSMFYSEKLKNSWLTHSCLVCNTLLFHTCYGF